MVIRRFDVCLINLDPTVGHEIQKIRPCVVISPDEMNRNLGTVIVAPMTTVIRNYPTRLLCEFQGKRGHVALDQIRAIDKTRLVKKMGPIATETQSSILSTLQELFAL